ncbi:MAG: hypothetical protein COY66_03105 [Candidatus Kerfeldbacteria bacterium CG_4_10_14_0_8_um_filter_42_10]|uniref:Uncharacterized protein n=1 Tax=Candidatus Kerfeldbacteria bacterium CG_4_10_14_0_8_um_filter_42_10 TaxID=2014248 RepID=A0A2M7RJW5_9BACT|nr:MAG: hypothetical protein COY66_03105 [Candidatus Kerfeldbacteria bacterium CG_4_10_14_0_8_um_filter_42_10]
MKTTERINPVRSSRRGIKPRVRYSFKHSPPQQATGYSASNGINIADKIIDKINTGKVKPESKNTVVFRKISFKIGLGFLVLLAIMVFSLVIFFVIEQSSLSALSFGSKGIIVFLKELPFSWLIFSLLLTVLVTIIVRKYTLAYRKSFKRTLTTMVIILILIGVFFSFTGFQEALAAKAAEGKLGFLKPVYQRALSCDFDRDYLLIGKVISIDKENGIAQVITKDHSKINLTWTPETKIISVPKQGDFFLALGYKQENGFVAQGIRKVTLSAIKNRCFNQALK